ncbi:TPA: endopeptidase La, partial [Candidatus Dependentiae bacterium]|nr:endopeptidase La [Candidatus Dependentiae bacterium]
MNKTSINSPLLETRQEEQNNLPIIPLKNVVLFPQSVIPLIIGRPRSIKAIEYASAHKTSICLVTQNDPSIEDPEQEDIFTTGTRANIIQVLPMAKGAVKVLVEGICRFSIQDTILQDGIWLAEGRSINYSDDQNSAEIHALWRRAKQVYKTYVNLHAQNQNNLSHNLQDFENIAVGADTLSAHNSLGFRDKQMLLEATNLKHQLMALVELLEREIEIVKIEERIRGRVQMQVEKNQREYYLNEQIKAINKELGRDDQEAEQELLLEKIAKARLPEAVHTKVERELRRLDQMPSLSAEASVSRNYIDWILQLPWYKESKDRISLVQAERILDKDHYGLQKVKERILEFIAAKKFNPELSRSPIICLVGPPGVGKTSLARSIAAALGREFARISLGGTRDESEIRGHRRTYVGAMPGKFIQALANIKTTNPVILLDEIDKMSQDLYGDPASALLEVLDPEQNKNFVDNYLEVAYNLSKTMFIATANSIDGIPYALFDRMEVINLSSYTEEEKLQIARKFLIPKLLKEYNLPARQFKLSRAVLSFIISQYTKEAGVRQLERILAKLIRKIIADLLTHEDNINKVITITPTLCRNWLGVPLFKRRGLSSQEH